MQRYTRALLGRRSAWSSQQCADNPPVWSLFIRGLQREGALTSCVLLRPKSIIFSRHPSLEDCRSRFSGFKSRCVTSCSWRYSIPSTLDGSRAIFLHEWVGKRASRASRYPHARRTLACSFGHEDNDPVVLLTGTDSCRYCGFCGCASLSFGFA